MIPTLYAKTETDFTHNGIGFLVDAIKCTVSEERNGSYELSLQYPITGRWYDKITEGAIIKAKANETSDLQLFRIYKSSKPLKGIVQRYISTLLTLFPPGRTFVTLCVWDSVQHSFPWVMSLLRPTPIRAFRLFG